MSILDTIKDLLDVGGDEFDQTLVSLINGVISTLNQFGFTIVEGFEITVDGDEAWSNIVGIRTDLNQVKTLIFLEVKKVFDPPASGPMIQSLDSVIAETRRRLIDQLEFPESA